MPEARARDKGGETEGATLVDAQELSHCFGARPEAATGNKDKEPVMDWDEVRTQPATGAMIGENLATLSVGELEARIGELEREIERVKGELAAKRKHEDAASALFKSK